MTESLLIENPLPGVALVTFNRPGRMNALNAELFDMFGRTMWALDVDESIRVIVLTGAGKGFCAGYDLNELQMVSRGSRASRIADVQKKVAAVASPKMIETPVVAAINGATRGGGFSIAAMADLRIASDVASFGVQFIKMGLPSSDAGLSWTLPRIVGHAVASDLMLTGRVIDAAEARAIGLVQEVVPADELRATALAKAEMIASNDRFALRQTKRVLAASMTSDLANALQHEIITQAPFVETEGFSDYVAGFGSPHLSPNG